MPAHGVLRSHRQPDDVPTALQRLPGSRLGPALLCAHRLDGPGQLGDGRDVDDQHPAGHQQPGDRLQDVPRCQHVEHGTVHRCPGKVGVGDVGDDQPPVRGIGTEERRDIAPGVLGVVVADLVRDHLPVGSDRAQQRTGQRAGSGTGLQHRGAGKDVALVDDLRGVLGVDHLRTARHRHHVVHQQWPQHQKRVAAGGLDHAALRQTDHVVVRDDAAVGVELSAGGEDHRVVPALGVG